MQCLQLLHSPMNTVSTWSPTWNSATPSPILSTTLQIKGLQIANVSTTSQLKGFGLTLAAKQEIRNTPGCFVPEDSREQIRLRLNDGIEPNTGKHMSRSPFLVKGGKPEELTFHFNKRNARETRRVCTLDCHAETSLRQTEVETTLTRISMGPGGATSTCSITSGCPGPHATAAARRPSNFTHC